MSHRQCRVCQQAFYANALLQYQNMPKSAQFLPLASELGQEQGADLEVCQCSGCGLIQLSNEPVFYYRDVIRAAAVSAEMSAFRQSQFADWVNEYQLLGKKVIEIGAGAGEYLSILGQTGVAAYGLENNQDSVTKCIEKGLNIEQGFIEHENRQLTGGPFDAFVMLNFLEHLPDPNTSLKGIHHNLKDDAIGLVEVPNFDMIVRNKLFSEFISDHLFYFTKDTLSHTLQRNGFDVLTCSETWHDYSLSAVVRKRIPMNLAVFDEQQARLAEELDNYIARFSNKGVAIWGAGHQALAVMSLAGLGDKIRYVVDSAPFKQNRYTPATHIPIVSPEQLNLDPVDAVIVMAASYSDEVASIVSQNYSGINIAVLRDYGLEIVKQLTAS